MNKTDLINRIKEAVAGAWGPTGDDPLDGERAKDIVADVYSALVTYKEESLQFVRVVFIEYPDHHRDVVTVLEDTSFEALKRLEHDIERLKPVQAHVGSLASVLTPVYPVGIIPAVLRKKVGKFYCNLSIYRDLSTGKEVWSHE